MVLLERRVGEPDNARGGEEELHGTEALRAVADSLDGSKRVRRAPEEALAVVVAGRRPESGAVERVGEDGVNVSHAVRGERVGDVEAIEACTHAPDADLFA